MADATLSQWHRLQELILRENNSFSFVQNMHANWGAVQRIGRGELTQAEIIEALKHIETKNPYAQASNDRALSIEEQVQLFLADIDVSHVEENIATAKTWMDQGAEGLFCYVRTETMATHFGIQNPWDNFGELTDRTVGLLSTRGEFYNYSTGQMGAKHHRLYASTKAAMQRIEAQQKGDIIVVPAQLGSLYQGKSAKVSRDLIEKSGNQFCLPAFIVGQIILVNPDILMSPRDLIIDCPGDEYRFDDAHGFGCILDFGFGGQGLYLYHSWLDDPYGYFGSASGFFQQ